MTSAEKLGSKQRLALAICDFLSTSTKDGTLAADDAESVDVAINCISECFKVDGAAAGGARSSASASLLTIFEAASARSSEAAAAAAADGGGKTMAEALKNKGNAAMAQRDYASAVGLYSQALELVPRNAIFLSNRAAAHSAAGDHEAARVDAEAAVAADPGYTKGWSRLGLARYALGDPRGAMEAYQSGMTHEGNGGSDVMRKGYEKAKRTVEDLDAAAGARSASTPSTAAPGAGGLPDLSSLASMFSGGAGGAGAGAQGGMPDLSSIMSNPMFAGMAQNLMSNPDLMGRLMNNPRLRDMASQFSSGGGMPDLNSLMSDPNIAEMARSMMGGASPGADNPSNPGRGSGPPNDS
ncbi:hypothetical protein CDD82_6137 [Ophiocordyceps australis]|uniref:SGTA homodimerisation domain-containing protein n=1 Tax=Ophiocordyceps australis TaxID=1399860 RepID=A0A2C5YWP3_9HYPO|nr:hypothetical protein CDD82_6137 [Ophiocordyceps australis]